MTTKQGLWAVMVVWWVGLATQLAAQTVAQQQQSIYFDTESYELSASAQTALQQLAEQLNTYGDYGVQVTAHTDTRGSVTYNQQLSDQRAQAVLQYLLQQGIRGDKAKNLGVGERQATNDLNNTDAQQQNRRVDVAITTYLFSTLAELLQRATEDQWQTFTIAPQQLQTITARNGTQLRIDAHTLVDEQGMPVSGSVQLRLREALSTDLMLLERLSTTSSDQLLETGGMVYISASSGNKTLQIKQGATIELSLPTAQRLPNMELFYAQTNATGAMDWVPTNESFNQTPASVAAAASAMPTISFSDFVAPPPMPMPTMPTFATAMPPCPTKAIMPMRPVEPAIPMRKKNVQKPKFPKSLFVSKKKRVANDEESFDRRMKIYERSYKAYTERLARYEQNMEKYRTYNASYQEQYEAWNSELHKRADALNKYCIQMQSYEASLRLQKAIAVWQKILPQFAQQLQNNPETVDHLEKHMLNTLLKYATDAAITPVNFKALNEAALGSAVMKNKDLRDGLDLCTSDEYRTAVNNLIISIFLSQNAYLIQSTRVQISDYLLSQGKLTKGLLNAYVGNISTLGWINCDRFYSIPAEQKMALSLIENKGAMVYAVLNDIKSVVPLIKKGDAYTTELLPKGTPITLVSIKLDAGKPLFSSIQTIVGEKTAYTPSYKSCSLKELKNKLKALN